jgi:hypothetical protein
LGGYVKKVGIGIVVGDEDGNGVGKEFILSND